MLEYIVNTALYQYDEVEWAPVNGVCKKSTALTASIWAWIGAYFTFQPPVPPKLIAAEALAAVLQAKVHHRLAQLRAQ